MSQLLSRFAESLFWLARYMERSENLARILQVNETFARDRSGASDWRPVLELNSDLERFLESHEKVTAKDVLHFYVLDRENPTSIIFSVRAARENARALRHLISTEMWSQLNVFHSWLLSLKKKDLALAELSTLCSAIKENCQTHAGITEGTFYRDESWCFYSLGRQLERVDQTSRLLDIKYRHPGYEGNDGTIDPTSDASLWNTLLRSGAGYHAFRRVQPRGMKAPDVAGFFLFDHAFPRSMTTSLAELDGVFTQLNEEYQLERGGEVAQVMGEIHEAMSAMARETYWDESLHWRMDHIQLLTGKLSNAIARRFFGQDA
ncbi:MAG: alpha-E domain-containing protein [Limibacillus sp.]|jgi:uncharacterized alpha-E superfamily protein